MVNSREAKQIVDFVIREIHKRQFPFLTDGKVDLTLTTVGTISGGTSTTGGQIGNYSIYDRHVNPNADIRGTKVRIATILERGTVQFAEDSEVSSTKAVRADDSRLLGSHLYEDLEDGEYCGSTISGVAGEVLVFGDHVILNDSGEWIKTTAAVEDKTNGHVGMVVLDSPLTVLLEGYVRNDLWSLTATEPAYISPISGAIVQSTLEFEDDYFLRVLGHAKSDHILWYNPENTVIKVKLLWEAESSVESFLGLTDTPDSFATHSGMVVVVKADESGLDFSDDFITEEDWTYLYNFFLATASGLNAHTEDTGNPHSVTKTQVGLGNVVNALQAISQSGARNIWVQSEEPSGIAVGDLWFEI
jgi:hypothetical protein